MEKAKQKDDDVTAFEFELGEVEQLLDQIRDELLNGLKKNALEMTKDARKNIHKMMKDLPKQKKP